MFSRTDNQVSNCVIEQLEYVLQPILFQVIREAFEPCAVYVAGYARKHGTSLATTETDSVRCGHEGTESAFVSAADPLFRAQARLDRAEKCADSRTEQPMREPSCGNLAELRRAKTWYRRNLSGARELIVTVQIDLG